MTGAQGSERAATRPEDGDGGRPLFAPTASRNAAGGVLAATAAGRKGTTEAESPRHGVARAASTLRLFFTPRRGVGGDVTEPAPRATYHGRRRRRPNPRRTDDRTPRKQLGKGPPAVDAAVACNCSQKPSLATEGLKDQGELSIHRRSFR